MPSNHRPINGPVDLTAEPENNVDSHSARRVLNVLILEDEWLNADLIGMLIEDCGCHVVGVAKNIAAATEIAAQHSLDLALVDVQLGQGADGITFAETLQSKYRLMIVFMTGAADSTTLRRIAAFNPFATILKPFTAQQLQEVLDRASKAA
jgi:CheY-like chemotaxis protein